MYKWLLFDADGTIFDFDAASAAALHNTFIDAGIPHTDETIAAYYRINHACWEAFERGEISAESLRPKRFERLLSELNHNGNPMAIGTYYANRLAEGTQLLDGATDMLNAVHGRHEMLLITNGLKEVQRPRFNATNMANYFPHVVISDEVGVAKPHPRIFDICFEKMGNPAKSEVLIIGDGLSSDMRGGLDYGIDTCWVNLKGKTRPADMPMTHEINNLSQLATILGAA